MKLPRQPPMSLATKERLEAALHSVTLDLQAVHSEVRFGFGAKMGQRLTRLIWGIQRLLEDVEKLPPDTSKREEPTV
jgi:hypothetical protein